VKFPDGYYFEFGGQFKNLQEAKARLMIVVPLALALIFVLIFLSFGSFRQATLIFMCVPLAVTGGIFALHGARHAVHHQRRRRLHRPQRHRRLERHHAHQLHQPTPQPKAARCAMPSSKARSPACARSS
jgi:hypothetical protein